MSEFDDSRNRARVTLMVWLAGQESEYASIVVPTPVFVPDDRLLELLRGAMTDPSSIELQFMVAPKGALFQWSSAEPVDLEDTLAEGAGLKSRGVFVEAAPAPGPTKRNLSDTEIYELIDYMDADGGIDHFTTSREAVFKLVVDAIQRELASHDAERKS